VAANLVQPRPEASASVNDPELRAVPSNSSKISLDKRLKFYYKVVIVMKDAYSLGQFELKAMLAVMQRRNYAYGLEIQEELKEKTGREVAVGAIYTTLARLKARKLVDSRLGDRHSDRLGRPRRYFWVTAAGFQAINDAREEMRSLSSGLKPFVSYPMELAHD
jgi:PadR family transcriptional regulator PadR